MWQLGVTAAVCVYSHIRHMCSLCLGMNTDKQAAVYAAV